MPNQPRADNMHKSIRVEDTLWEKSRTACIILETTRSEVARKALEQAVRKADAKIKEIESKNTQTVPDEEPATEPATA